MGVFPIHLELAGRRVLVVGGGEVACRKVQGVVEAGGDVTVIAPEVVEPLRTLAMRGVIGWRDRPVAAGDTAGFSLVFAATSDPVVNRRVADEARGNGGLVCRVDDPAEGDFVTPALFRDGDLLVSVGCGGVPLLAAAIRDRVARDLGGGWGRRIREIRTRRENLLTRSPGHSYNKKILKRLYDDVSSRVRDGRFDEIAPLFDAVASSAAETGTSSGGDQ